MKEITSRKVIINSALHADLVVARPQGLRVPGAVTVQRSLLVGLGDGYPPVSYTHLTLPTICSV
eukprot:1621809-Alexandrium_andersonii.AAC.1